MSLRIIDIPYIERTRKRESVSTPEVQHGQMVSFTEPRSQKKPHIKNLRDDPDPGTDKHLQLKVGSKGGNPPNLGPREKRERESERGAETYDAMRTTVMARGGGACIISFALIH